MGLLVLTILFNLLLTGSLQDMNSVNSLILSQPNLDGHVLTSADESWPVQTIHTVQGKFFGQAFRNINSKPCTGRRNLQNLQEQWIPTFSSKLIKPITHFDSSSNLMPIKEEIDYTDNALHIMAPTNTENIPTPAEDNNDNGLYKTRNSLSVGNSFEDSVENLVDQSEPLIENRVGFESPVFHEIYPKYEDPTINYSQNDQLVEKEDHNEVETVEIVKEPVSEVREETTKTSEECFNKKPVDQHGNRDGDSRRYISSLNKQTGSNLKSNSPEPMEANDNDLRDNNSNEYIGLGNNNLATIERNAADSNKNKDIDARKSISSRIAVNQKVFKQSENPRYDLVDPTKGVSDLSDSRMMLMDHSRICYACSSASNPTCWAPDRKTTVKYCRKGHESCVSKTFQTGSTVTMIRDCGNSCEDVDVPKFVPKYKSCSICQSDLCNSAYSINSSNVFFAIFLISVIKYMS